MKPVIETCCTSLEEALDAQKRGASRIELCVNLAVGGITPPRSLIREVVGACSIPVNVLIKPEVAHNESLPGNSMGFTAGDFVYGEKAISQMTEDIHFSREAGAAGIVVGALTAEGKIDLHAMRRLMDAAGPLPVTFHRAFDVSSEDPADAIDKLIGLGCARLLTSGKAPSAQEGKELIAKLVSLSRGRIIVMPGAGVKPYNLRALQEETDATEFHGTAIP